MHSTRFSLSCAVVIKTVFFLTRQITGLVFLLTHRHCANGILSNSLTNITMNNSVVCNVDKFKWIWWWFKTGNPRNSNGISFERVEGTHYHAECMRANLWEHIQCLIGILFIKSKNRTWAKSCVLCVLLVQWALVRLRWWIFMFAVSANRPFVRPKHWDIQLSLAHTLYLHTKTHILRTRK